MAREGPEAASLNEEDAMKNAVMTPEPKEKRANRTVVRLQRGDLTSLPVDAFVFYAKEGLELGSGFGTAIQLRGGDSIKKCLDKMGTIRMGEAVITPAGSLPARHIIHACGPKFQESDMEGKLRTCMRSVLRCADANGVKSLALPPMGAGFYGVPLALCSKVMLEEIQSHLGGKTSLEAVTICVIDKQEFMAFEGRFENL